MLFFCYYNGMDNLVHTFIDTVTLFISPNDQLNLNQSGFSSGRSTETALLSVIAALQIAKADSKSSVLILLDLSATFDTVKSYNYPVYHHRINTPLVHWFEPYLTDRYFRVAWGGEESKEHQLVTGFPQGSVIGLFLFTIYTTSLGLWDYTCTRFLLPLLCWWQTALLFISTRQPNSSCMDLRLPGKHLGMDEGTTPAAQPGKDWASCFPCHSESTAWFHHPARFIKKYSWWPADLQGPDCKDSSILQVCIAQGSGLSKQSMLHNFFTRPLLFLGLDYCNAFLAGLHWQSNLDKWFRMQ